MGTNSVSFDSKKRLLYLVIVANEKQPAKYEVLTANIQQGNITSSVETSGNTDFSFTFLLA